jgi:GT2 family glycosyltransferase
MKTSIIVATYGRKNELMNLLISIANQNYRNFEVIIIDQKLDDRVNKILKSSELLAEQVEAVKHNTQNASEARNIGIKRAAGEILFFPDDDARLPSSFLATVVQKFRRNPQIDFLSVPVIDPAEITAFIPEDNCKPLTFKNARTLTTGSGVLYRRQIIEKIQNFDPNLGPGTELASSEDLDLVLRVLYGGHRGCLFPGTFVIHENPVKIYDNITAQRAYRYNKGFGAFVKKHLKNFGNQYFLLVFICECLKNLANMFIHWPGNPARAKYNYLSLIGKIKGFVRYRKAP